MSGPRQLPSTTFRTSEPCEVKELHYYIEEQSKMTVLRATLRLLEGTGARRTSNSKNTFVVEIPPPLVGEFSEFVVKLTTFQEQVEAVLHVGSPVNSNMVNADGRSQFYRGTVTADKLSGRALESAELYTEDVLERYTVRYSPFVALHSLLKMVLFKLGIIDRDSKLRCTCKAAPCLQVQWEDTTTDDLSPWEVFSADVTEEDLSNKLKASNDEVKKACQKVADKCHSIIVQVCPCARQCLLLPSSELTFSMCLSTKRILADNSRMWDDRSCCSLGLKDSVACSCRGHRVHSRNFQEPTSSRSRAVITGMTRRCTICMCRCH
jgi:hypothetical protein